MEGVEAELDMRVRKSLENLYGVMVEAARIGKEASEMPDEHFAFALAALPVADAMETVRNAVLLLERQVRRYKRNRRLMCHG